MKKYNGTIVVYEYQDEEKKIIKEKMINVVVEGGCSEEAMYNLWNVVNKRSVPELKDEFYPDFYLFEIDEDDEIREAI